MCNCCQSFFCGVANALDNLFTCPCGNNGNNGCGCNGNNGNGGIANAVNNLFSGGCGCNGGNNGNNGCGCNGGFDVYYMQQYALGPFASGCNVCGF